MLCIIVLARVLSLIEYFCTLSLGFIVVLLGFCCTLLVILVSGIFLVD